MPAAASSSPSGANMDVDTSKRGAGLLSTVGDGTEAAKKSKKRDKEEHTIEGYRKLIELFAVMGLSTANQVRVVKGIAVTTMVAKRDLKMQQDEKTLMESVNVLTKGYFEQTKNLRPNEKAARGPVHALVAHKILTWTVDYVLGMEDMPDDREVVENFKRIRTYCSSLKDFKKDELVMLDLSRKVRYCRLLTAFKAGKMKVEIAPGPSIAGQVLVETVVFVWRNVLEAEEKAGTAPPNNLERMIKQQLAILGGNTR
eukprot:TRINITY_DN75762_c0_g1_i1.p1 TRINITY_DN75762_c0_g1~~TRINITY_DN75762_c0_g1_i1.p1  ORF type:complete len:256 (+),score=56.30 TRINITY_DN75762_c0_g1_i1:398-1165(+)